MNAVVVFLLCAFSAFLALAFLSWAIGGDANQVETSKIAGIARDGCRLFLFLAFVSFALSIGVFLLRFQPVRMIGMVAVLVVAAGAVAFSLTRAPDLE
jgi:hypothetical protein